MKKRCVSQYSFLLFCSVIIMLGCQSKIDYKEIPGIYIAEYPYGVEQLKITSDGFYEQSFGTSDKTLTFLNKGKWDIRLEGRKIVLKNPVMVADGFGKKSLKPFSGDWFLLIQKGLWGQLAFSINGDLDLKFKKVE